MLDLAEIALEAAPGTARGLDHDIEDGGMQHGGPVPVAAPRRKSLMRHRASSAPAKRGRMKRALSFSRRTCARVLPTKATKLLPRKNKGRRSAEKARLSRGASPRDQMLPPAHASGAAARSAERARLSALPRGADC